MRRVVIAHAIGLYALRRPVIHPIHRGLFFRFPADQLDLQNQTIYLDDYSTIPCSDPHMIGQMVTAACPTARQGGAT
jgi:hypothetical protein